MSADTGMFSNGKHPRTQLEPESKQHVMVTAQRPPLGSRGRPVTDAMLNSMGKIALNLVRRAVQQGAGNGATSTDTFAIFGDTVTNNKFTIGTASTTNYEQMSRFFLGGIQAIIPIASSSIAMDTTSANSEWIHRRLDVGATGSRTVFTDSASLWPSLGARTVRLLQNNGTWATRTLASNTNSTFTVSAAITVGAGATEIPPNAYYYFEPTTPSGADRDDAVWLDVFFQEVGGTAHLPGTDAAAVTDSSVDEVVGTSGANSYESTRRWRVKQSIFVEQGAIDGSNFVDGGVTELTGSNLVTWVDAAGLVHFSAQLAVLERLDGEGLILPHQVKDVRDIVGVGGMRDVMTVFADIAGGAWITELPTITRALDGLTVTVGSAYTLCSTGTGIMALRLVRQREFTARSDGTAWGDETTHYIYADLATGQYKCETTLPAFGVAPVLRFLSTPAVPGPGGQLPAFTKGEAYDDLRRGMGLNVTEEGFSNRFKFNSLGYATRAMEFDRLGGDPDSVTPGVTLKSGATTIGKLQAVANTVELSSDLAGGLVSIKNTAASSPGIHVGGTSGATANNIYVGGASTGVVKAVTLVDVGGSSTGGPAEWHMRKVYANELRAPHVVLCDTYDTPAAVDGSIWTPGGRGFISHQRAGGATYLWVSTGSLSGVFSGSTVIRPDYDATIFDLSGFDLLNVNGTTDVATKAGNLNSYFQPLLFPAGGATPHLTVPLRVPRGTYFDGVMVHIRSTFTVASANLELVASVTKRVDTSALAPTALPLDLATDTMTLVGTGPVTGSADSFEWNTVASPGADQRWLWTLPLATPIYVNDERSLYLQLRATSNSTFATATGLNAVWVMGVEASVTVRGFGKKPTTPDGTNYISYPIEGL